MVSKSTLFVCYWLLSVFPSDGKTSVDSVRDALGIYCWRHKLVSCLTGH
jgi:hypothetical protein